MVQAQRVIPAAPPPAGSERPAEVAFRALIRSLGLIERVMQPYFAGHGITGSQWGVLRALHRAALEGKNGLRLTDLGARLIIRPPSVTGVIDRLERMGLVVREASADDQRAKHVTLTPAARQLIDKVLANHAAQVDAVLGGLSPEEQVQLQRLMAKLKMHLEKLADGAEDSA